MEFSGLTLTVIVPEKMCLLIKYIHDRITFKIIVLHSLFSIFLAVGTPTMTASIIALLLSTALLLSPSHAFQPLKQSLHVAPPTTRLSMSSSPSTTTTSVAIIGMGVLGTSLAKQLLETTEYTLLGITKSISRHNDLVNEICTNKSYKERLTLKTMDEALNDNEQYANVVFCAPPSGFDDYASAVDSAARLRSSGSFIFTSSGGVYPDSLDGEIVKESTPLNDDNPRKARGINAEKACVENGGCVLRLSGLYTLERGAHNYWLEKSNGVVKGRDDGIINLLHYDDAASSVVSALRVGTAVNGGKVFLISDGHFTTRRGICESALKSARYMGCEMPEFQGGDGETRGKIYDGSWSEETLDWKPKYRSFDEFMKNSA